MYAYHASSDAYSACTYNACMYAKHTCLYCNACIVLFYLESVLNSQQSFARTTTLLNYLKSIHLQLPMHLQLSLAVLLLLNTS